MEKERGKEGADDIVKTLRYLATPDQCGRVWFQDVFTKAADEIERLRAEVDDLDNQLTELTSTYGGSFSPPEAALKEFWKPGPRRPRPMPKG